MDKRYIGEIRKGSEIGKKHKYNKFVWHACEQCGKQRWVRLMRGKPESCFCHSCRAKQQGYIAEYHPNWKGGRLLTSAGYISIYMPNHPYADTRGYIREHRYIMEQLLGRLLLPSEICHHINEIRTDNRPENIVVLENRAEHRRIHSKRE